MRRHYSNMKIKGSTFVVTGGCSGLGKATVDVLVKHGANVVAVDLQITEDAAHTGRVCYAKANVCSSGEVEAAIAKGVKQFGSLQGLINCAGIGAPTKVVGRDNKASDLAKFEKVINVNVVGTFNVLRLAAAQMSRQKIREGDTERGVIINIASVAAFDGQIGQVSYSASKGAIVSMALPLARELSQHAIRVMTLAPGVFQTPMVDSLGEKVKHSLEQQVPYPKRVGDPRTEFAALCCSCIENTYLNGECIRIDGAIRMAAM